LTIFFIYINISLNGRCVYENTSYYLQ